MRYYLDCLAEIVAAAFLVDDALVYAAGCDVVGACCRYISEALIMTEIKVGFMTVDGYVALAVLVRV